MGTGDIEGEEPNVAPEDILAEAERRVQARRAADGPSSREEARQRTALRLNQGVFWLAKHWVALFNGLILLYVAGAVAPAILMHVGRTGLAGALHAVYRPFCHQYPFRSWFLFGSAAAHPLEQPISILEMNRLSRFVGDAEVGYKMALCQRDIAIYGMMFVGGLVYGLARRRWTIKPLPLWLYFLFGVMPMMLDGGVQWLSYAVWQFFPGLLAQPFETIPTLRTLTGSLFGLGVIAVGYPYMGEYFGDVAVTLEEKLSAIGCQRSAVSQTRK